MVSVGEECLVKGNLKKQRCTVKMKGVAASRRVIDLDKLGPPLSSNSERCDYLMIYSLLDQRVFLIPIELKRGK